MADRELEQLDRQLRRIEKELPVRAARTLQWLREPSSRWIRIPVGVLAVIGGLLSFLPILGLWMLPLGLLLLAQDVPPLRRPTRRALIRIEQWWVRRKRKRRLATR
ncbi:hypothetical protein [Geminicoccus roseus]|uniref:hypothetical protein n=1 Tax=Geminicoccus roseus TaxID=404900 RepID=UPI0003F8EECC|nr:hypothetical protein [Geminicoccus roseus]